MGSKQNLIDRVRSESSIPEAQIERFIQIKRWLDRICHEFVIRELELPEVVTFIENLTLNSHLDCERRSFLGCMIRMLGMFCESITKRVESTLQNTVVSPKPSSEEVEFYFKKYFSKLEERVIKLDPTRLRPTFSLDMVTPIPPSSAGTGNSGHTNDQDGLTMYSLFSDLFTNMPAILNEEFYDRVKEDLTEQFLALWAFGSSSPRLEHSMAVPEQCYSPPSPVSFRLPSDPRPYEDLLDSPMMTFRSVRSPQSSAVMFTPTSNNPNSSYPSQSRTLKVQSSSQPCQYQIDHSNMPMPGPSMVQCRENNRVSQLPPPSHPALSWPLEIPIVSQSGSDKTHGPVPSTSHTVASLVPVSNPPNTGTTAPVFHPMPSMPLPRTMTLSPVAGTSARPPSYRAGHSRADATLSRPSMVPPPYMSQNPTMPSCKLSFPSLTGSSNMQFSYSRQSYVSLSRRRKGAYASKVEPSVSNLQSSTTSFPIEQGIPTNWSSLNADDLLSFPDMSHVPILPLGFMPGQATVFSCRDSERRLTAPSSESLSAVSTMRFAQTQASSGNPPEIPTSTMQLPTTSHPAPCQSRFPLERSPNIPRLDLLMGSPSTSTSNQLRRKAKPTEPRQSKRSINNNSSHAGRVVGNRVNRSRTISNQIRRGLEALDQRVRAGAPSCPQIRDVLRNLASRSQSTSLPANLASVNPTPVNPPRAYPVPANPLPANPSLPCPAPEPPPPAYLPPANLYPSSKVRNHVNTDRSICVQMRRGREVLEKRIGSGARPHSQMSDVFQDPVFRPQSAYIQANFTPVNPAPANPSKANPSRPYPVPANPPPAYPVLAKPRPAYPVLANPHPAYPAPANPPPPYPAPANPPPPYPAPDHPPRAYHTTTNLPPTSKVVRNQVNTNRTNCMQSFGMMDQRVGASLPPQSQMSDVLQNHVSRPQNTSILVNLGSANPPSTYTAPVDPPPAYHVQANPSLAYPALANLAPANHTSAGKDVRNCVNTDRTISMRLRRGFDVSDQRVEAGAASCPQMSDAFHNTVSRPQNTSILVNFGSVYSASANPSPTYHAPANPPPAYRAPANPPPAYRAPATTSPAYHAQANPPPAYRAPAPPSPAYHAQASPPPAYRAPATPSPAYHAQANPPPAYRAPATPSPAYHAQANPPPAYHAQANPPPAYHAPANPLPEFRAPVNPPAVHRAPANPPPAYHAPANPPPVYHAPANPPPVYRAPATPSPAYDAQANPPPTYRAPVTSPPAYHAPANPPPVNPVPENPLPVVPVRPTPSFRFLDEYLDFA